jgi:hypothetical protein
MWREAMKIRELIDLLEQLPDDMEIFVAITHEGGDVRIAEVTESCSDRTVIGYMITDETAEVH